MLQSSSNCVYFHGKIKKVVSKILYFVPVFDGYSGVFESTDVSGMSLGDRRCWQSFSLKLSKVGFEILRRREMQFRHNSKNGLILKF